MISSFAAHAQARAQLWRMTPPARHRQRVLAGISGHGPTNPDAAVYSSVTGE
ncbi:MAG TPA: hypothetical protein VM791_08885 [Vicinamibacterales bacterium]|nr:hypothetical protein [Vicinamibacterales bacterium]